LPPGIVFGKGDPRNRFMARPPHHRSLWSSRIFWKLLLACAGLNILAAVVVGLILSDWFQRQIIDQVDHRLRIAVLLVRDELSSQVLTGRSEKLQQLVRKFGQDTRRSPRSPTWTITEIARKSPRPEHAVKAHRSARLRRSNSRAAILHCASTRVASPSASFAPHCRWQPSMPSGRPYDGSSGALSRPRAWW
jgi:hypothetical protein